MEWDGSPEWDGSVRIRDGSISSWVRGAISLSRGGVEDGNLTGAISLSLSLSLCVCASVSPFSLSFSLCVSPEMI